jgi:hypothetical protein
MAIWYNNIWYSVGDFIPEDVPLANIYARVNGRLTISNWALFNG